MHARRYRWLILMLLGIVLAAGASACAGGSGSSGFDAFPESAAINQAIDMQECVERKNLMICPADETGRAATATPTSTPTPTGTPIPILTQKPSTTATPAGVLSPTPHLTATPTQPTPTPTIGSPTPPSSPRVDTGVDTTTPIPCAPLDATSACNLVVPFAPQGFGPDAIFRVAVRSLEPGAQWMIGPEPIPAGPLNAPNFDATVAVDTAAHAPTASVTVQIAILVFRHPVETIPAEVAELADSGADFAFITTTLTVQPAVAEPAIR